jgi:outer membrane biosynthesis protein TonB
VLRIALAVFVASTAALAGAQGVPVQPGSANQQPTPPSAGGTNWPADPTNTVAPTPPAFVTGLGDAGNNEALSRAPKVVRVSGGVMAAQLVRRVQPVYPSTVSSSNGTVVLATRVGRDGRVKGVSVISGPPELQKPTVDAVKQWLYRPYLLNGEPVAVEFTVALGASRSRP